MDRIAFDIEGFYPTPKPLVEKMLAKVQRDCVKILEPSAGKGDIIDVLNDEYNYHRRERRFCGADISAIEINPDLQALLRGKGIKVIDGDFLAYSGPDKYDLILMNPDFASGDAHLMKAVEIMYSGEIVCLLNAETIRNPHTNLRKTLVSKLAELNADIEYIQGAFKGAERPTGVEIAMVYINIERKVEDDLFRGASDTMSEPEKPGLERNFEVSTKLTVAELVAEYNQIVRIGTETIVGYYRNYRKVGKYIGLNRESDKYQRGDGDLTALMQNTLNAFLVSARIDFWRRTLDIPEVRKRMTSKKAEEFEAQLKAHCDMDFTENNIRQFIINLIGSYEQTLFDAVAEIFDKFTVKHCYSNGLYDENIHYFNGWKTNKAFKVNRKVIMPVYGRCGGAFVDYSGLKLDYAVSGELRDIDIVMNYFDGMEGYYSLSDAIADAFRHGQSTKIRSTYFTVNCYKKGTIHLTFNDEDILRRFNTAACIGKTWLPHDYGRKAYQDMPQDEKEAVDGFEGVVSYASHMNQPLFATRSFLRLE